MKPHLVTTNSKVIKKRAWLLGGYLVRYETSGDFSLGTISDGITTLTKYLFTKTLPETLQDISGVQDELLYIDGTCGLAPMERSPFTFRLKSKFRETTRDHHMILTLKEERSGDFPDSLSIQELGTSIPISPSTLNLGIKIYRPKRFIGILGFMPTEIGELTFKLTKSTFSLNCRYLVDSASGSIPFNHIYIGSGSLSILEAIRRTIEEITGRDVLADLQKT